MLLHCFHFLENHLYSFEIAHNLKSMVDHLLTGTSCIYSGLKGPGS